MMHIIDDMVYNFDVRTVHIIRRYKNFSDLKTTNLLKNELIILIFI